MIFPLEYRIHPNVKAHHHLEVARDLLALLIVVVEVLGLDSEEVAAEALVEGVEQHSVEVFVQLRGRVFH